MKVTIVYDSIFGNTAKVAEAIAAGLGGASTVELLTVQAARTADLAATELLIVGSPTRGFRPTPLIVEFVEGLPQAGAGQQAAAFDTRLDVDAISPPPLRWVVEAGGYAGTRIAAALARHGFAMRGETGGFLVTGTEGPLKEHELERAIAWGLALLDQRAAGGR